MGRCGSPRKTHGRPFLGHGSGARDVARLGAALTICCLPTLRGAIRGILSRRLEALTAGRALHCLRHPLPLNLLPCIGVVDRDTALVAADEIPQPPAVAINKHRTTA